jgi:Tol biopolymer transport system component
MKRIFLIALIASICYPQANAKAQQIDLKQLTNDPYQDGYAAWSPDGRFIIYTSVRDEKEYLWKIPAEGGEPVKVTEHRSHHGRFSPDGAFIAFDGEDGTLVQIMSASGGVPIRIVPESIPIKGSGLPCWSPDGSRIAFRSLYDLYVLELPVAKFSKIFHKEGYIPIPNYWPKMDNFILTALLNPATKENNIWKVPLDGGEAQQLTFHESASNADVSPDGSYIVFSSFSSKDRNADLWIMPYEGGEPMQLTFEPSREFEARSSPDGNKLVFTSTKSGHWDIWIMTLDLRLIAQKLRSLNAERK